MTAAQMRDQRPRWAVNVEALQRQGYDVRIGEGVFLVDGFPVPTGYFKAATVLDLVAYIRGPRPNPRRRS